MTNLKNTRISVANPVFNGNEKKYLNEAIDSGWISSVGKFVSSFEDHFTKYIGGGPALTCSNGTTALHLALLAHDVGPGDEVIVPTLTYVASANAVKYCGATPVLIDSDPISWNLDPNLLEKAITKKTKGIMVVHLYGLCCNMDPINEIAKKHGLFVLEDAAESLGATYKNKMSGSLGDSATFSFFGNKTLTCGEGGMVVCPDDNFKQKVFQFRGQGMDFEKRYWFPIIGYNYRMTNIQAAIGLAQLENIEWHLKRRSEIASQYREELSELNDLLSFQEFGNDYSHSYWMVSILLNKKNKVSRDEVITKLNDLGIESRPIFYPMHIMPVYKETLGKYPIAEHIGENGLSLPTHGMLTMEDVHRVCEGLKQILK